MVDDLKQKVLPAKISSPGSALGESIGKLIEIDRKSVV